MIMDPLDNGGNILIEMIEVCDELHKAKVNESIFASNNTAIDFFLPRS